jgi:hypothetical protein
MSNGLAPGTQLYLNSHELAFMLRRLGLANLPGITPPKDFDDHAATAVEASLRLRGLLGYNAAGEAQLSQPLAEVLRAAVLPAAMRFLLAQTYTGSVVPARTSQYWVYFTPSLASGVNILLAQHHSGEANTYCLEGLADQATLLETLRALLEIDLAQTDLPDRAEFSLSQAQWRQVAEVARQSDAVTVAGWLSRRSAPPLFVEALSAPQFRITIGEGAQALLLIRVQAGYWLVANDADTVRITPANGQNAFAALANLVKQ